MKALELLQDRRGGRKAYLRCLETGETYRVGEWAKAIAGSTGTRSSSVAQALTSAVRNRAGKYRGLTFERVVP